MILNKQIYRIFLIFVILGLGSYIALVINIYKYADINEKQNIDAIVVMGAGQWNGKPSSVLRARLDHALALYMEGVSSNIILTGGVGRGEEVSESRVGMNYLIGKNIDRSNIFVEEIGRTSWQSLIQVVKILEKNNLKSIIIVSDGFHMLRLSQMSKDLEIQAYLSAVSGNYMSKLSEFKYVIRETSVYLLHILFKV
jgi:uncharacterized SAM-binding protein YcdF (DUF218 family)